VEKIEGEELERKKEVSFKRKKVENPSFNNPRMVPRRSEVLTSFMPVSVAASKMLLRCC
jgi:hypothetical protein